MTPAQDEALSAANRILSEHFESSVIVVVGTIPGEDEDRTADVTGIYHGGYCTAIGLLQHHLHVLLNQPAKRSGTIEDPEDDE